MNSAQQPLSTPQNPSSVVTIDAIFIAQQFERINTTLEFMQKAAEKQNEKEVAQDLVISGLAKDMVEVKADVRSIKDSKSPKLHPVTIVVGIMAIAGVVLGILNQLYDK